MHQSVSELRDQRLGHLPVDVVTISTNLVEHQVIIELQDFEIVLGEESAPGTDVLSHIGELGQVISGVE